MKHVIVEFVFFLALYMLTGSTYALNLNSIIEEALDRNPGVIAAREEWKGAEAKITAARNLPDPQFSIGYEEIPEESFSPGDAEMKMYIVSQMIPFPGKLTLKTRISGKDALMAQEQYETRRNEIIEKVKSAYYALFFVHKSIEINKENKELIQNFARIAESKYSVGTAAQHDVLKAQVELLLIIDDLITLEDEKLPAAVATLNTLLNRRPGSLLVKPEDFEVPTLDKNLEQLQQIALNSHPVLEYARCVKEKSEVALALAKMGYLPDFVVKLKQEEMRMAMGTETSRGIAISATIPLWFWKQNSGVKEKRAYKRAAESYYQEMKNLVLLNIQTTLADFKTSGRRVNLFKTSIIPQTEQTLKSATIAYQTGKIDFLTLINSERMLRNARLKYFKVLTKHGTNFAHLERAVGVRLSD